MKADAVKIKDGVYWVGVLDWDIRIYHGYTLNGTSYNAYLVFGEDKVALIENAYPGNFPELMARVEDAFNKEDKEINIDVIVAETTWRRSQWNSCRNCTEISRSPGLLFKNSCRRLMKHFPSLEGV
jgi:predicted Zn-dependent protease